MTVKALYDLLCAAYPASLSEEWDNDGLLCSADPSAEITSVLCALDVTDGAIARAVELGANVILSHHPLIFHPLTAITPDDPQAKKVITLLAAGISVLSFHTRADAAPGGVNDLLASALSLRDAVSFGSGIGRVGVLPSALSLFDFAEEAKQALSAPRLLVGSAGRPVLRVAVVGGSGKSELSSAIETGADTFLSGRLSYEITNAAAEYGINLIEAGHFATEALLPRHWAEELTGLGISTEYYDSYTLTLL